MHLPRIVIGMMSRNAGAVLIVLKLSSRHCEAALAALAARGYFDGMARDVPDGWAAPDNWRRKI